MHGLKLAVCLGLLVLGAGAPGGQAVLEVKILIFRGSRDQVLQEVIA